jgi:hypothetical protein
MSQLKSSTDEKTLICLANIEESLRTLAVAERLKALNRRIKKRGSFNPYSDKKNEYSFWPKSKGEMSQKTRLKIAFFVRWNHFKNQIYRACQHKFG